jgi:hypothetical protein
MTPPPRLFELIFLIANDRQGFRWTGHSDSSSPSLPREKTSTNEVNCEKNRKLTLDFWLAAWHRFR